MGVTRASSATCAFHQSRGPIPSSSSSTGGASRPALREPIASGASGRWPTPSKQTGLRRGPSYVANPLPVRGVMDLAGPVDMTADIPGYEALCGDTVITSLLGGTPAAVPDHYAQ